MIENASQFRVREMKPEKGNGNHLLEGEYYAVGHSINSDFTSDSNLFRLSLGPRPATDDHHFCNTDGHSHC